MTPLSLATDAPTEPAAPAPSTDPVEPDRAIAFGLRAGDLGAAFVVAVLCLGHVPTIMFPSWSLRYAALLTVLPIGLLSLASLIRRRDRAAIAATAFLASAFISGALATASRISLLGWIGSDTFWLMYVLVIALWAWARSFDARRCSVVERTLVGALALNVVWAVFQMAFNIQGGTFNVFPGRASGFFSNPAYYAAAMGAGFAWAAWRSPRDASRLHIAAIAFFGFGCALSGARLTFVTAFLILVAVSVTFRARRVVVFWLAAIVGLAGGSVVTTSVAGSNGASRFGQDGAGRTAVWRFMFEAWTDRPVFGWGLGRQAVAMQSRMSESFSITGARDDAWSDPHNIVVLLLATTGVVGLGLVIVFGVTAVRAATLRPTLVMALVIGVNYALQPATIHTLPLAMLLLGAAAHSTAVPHAMTARRAGAVAVAVGLVVGAVSLVPAYQFRSALLARDAEAMESWTWWYRSDPYISDKIAATYGELAREGAATGPDAVEWARRTIEAEPDRAKWRAQGALREIQFRDYDAARANLDRAIELHPWNVAAHEARYLLAIIEKDEPTRVEAYTMICRLDSDLCVTEDGKPPSVEDLVATTGDAGE